MSSLDAVLEKEGLIGMITQSYTVACYFSVFLFDTDVDERLTKQKRSVND